MTRKKSEKQNKDAGPVSRKKIPKESDSHLAFSITRDAHHDQSNHGHVKKSTYQLRKERHAALYEEDTARRQLLAVKKEELATKPPKQAKKTTSRMKASRAPKKKPEGIKVTMQKHRRSPYVVALKKEVDEMVDEVLDQVIRNEKKEEAVEDWKKEVVRLRREAVSLRGTVRDAVRINFLQKQKKFSLRHRLQSSKTEAGAKKEKSTTLKWSGFGSLSASALIFLKRILFGILRWVYEFLLSIPLGILLLLHGVLVMVEMFFKGVTFFAWKTSKIIAVLFEQVILSIVAIIKGIVLIPTKLVIIGLLSVYRAFGFAGVQMSSIFRILREWGSHMANTLVHPPRGFMKRLLAFTACAIVFILPVKYLERAPTQVSLLQGRVLGAAQEGFSLLGSLEQNFETGSIEAAQENLDSAHARFSEARETLDSLNVAVRGIVKLTPQGAAGFHLVAAAEEMTQGAALLSTALSPFVSSEDDSGIAIDKIASVSASLRAAAPRLSSAASHIAQVSPDAVPESYRDRFVYIQSAMPDLQKAVDDMLDVVDVVASVIGADRPKRYAVLFQNNNELRPAGGFIGSLALADFDQGRLVNMEIPGGGSYDFQGYLTEHVISPKPLWIVNPHWQLHDANWYPDWPTSAEKVAWFIEKSGDSSVDGVIALQASTLEKLLKILGPIEFPEYGVTLDADTVIREMQEAVEFEYDKEENNPKQYVAELVPHVIDRILSSDSQQFVELLSLMQEEIEQKNALFYFRDSEIQQAFTERGWSPHIVRSERDYLSVVNANIGGGKTDGVIQESWNHEVTISEDGAVSESLTILRHHGGSSEDVFESFNNVDYARLYVPGGSEFVSAVGFEPPRNEFYEEPGEHYVPDEQLSSIEGKVLVDEASGTRINNEFGKTVFGNWMQTMPGGTSLATFSYTAPFKVKPFDLLNPDARSGYSLLIQKQPGARPAHYSLILRYPAGWNIHWKKAVGDAELREVGRGMLMVETELNKDTGFGLLFADD